MPQMIDKNNQGFQRIQVANKSVSTSEEMLICEASVQVDTALASASVSPGNFDSGYIHVNAGTLLDWCQYELIMTLNGLEICYAGPFTAYHRRQPIYMCGTAPVEAGSNTVELFIRFYVDRDGGTTHTWESSVTSLNPRITQANIMVIRRKR